ncbi:hypothetical protein A3I95_01395 [Candidatus Nomurabacteria bacterium RIFCSPLOWO2_02_FULL_44_12]|nr:MAG: hypothetical protein A3E95_01180 [Candidatus Nomurabacteria bacterium RIFCSPHIGHO2_12_FULL_44_22b]OGJ08348.1 MAG: hypothetical protein A3I95_01395 [Candidatus Nomurabacteria bacterium RIFCSPLOWO2_02_FULL_44_12]
MVKEKESTIQGWVGGVKKMIYPVPVVGGTKVGQSSLAVTLPKDLVRKLGWKEKQKVVIKKIRGGLVIRDWRK